MDELTASAPSDDWSVLLRAYETAVAEFETLSRALTDALLAGNPGGDYRELLAAEAKARDAVLLTRMRLVNLWRDKTPLDTSHAVPQGLEREN